MWISLAVFIVAFVGFQVTPTSDDEASEAKTEQTSSKAKSSSDDNEDTSDELSQKSLNDLENLINKDLNSADTGNTSWKWNKDEEAWVATLDPNSEMYGDMENGEVSVWNSYVREVQEISKSAKDGDSSKYSTFRLKNPSNTDRSYLVVEDGKVKYNVGEDLD